MNWTKEKPKVDGWYCWRTPDAKPWAVAEVRMFTGSPCWHSMERHAWVGVWPDMEWAGPIPTPSGAPATTPDWTDPGHRLTHDEIRAVKQAFNAARQGWTSKDRNLEGALEYAIRTFLTYQRGGSKAPSEIMCPNCEHHWTPGQGQEDRKE